MTHSLFLAQQSAIHRLEELEDEVTNEARPDEGSTVSPDSRLQGPPASLSTDTSVRHRRNRSSTIIDAVVYPASIMSNSSESKRTSVLLNECVFETTLSPLGTGRGPRTFDHRQSIVHSDALLRRWTKHLESTPAIEFDFAEKSVQEEPSNESMLEPLSSLDIEADSENDYRSLGQITQAISRLPETSENQSGTDDKLRTSSSSSTIRKPPPIFEKAKSVVVPLNFGFNNSYSEDMSSSVKQNALADRNNIINVRDGESLYQICLKLRRRLSEVPGFGPYLEQMEEQEADGITDPVSSLWRCFRNGLPLLTIYNASQPEEGMLEVDTTKDEKRVGKEATCKFIMACIKHMEIPAQEIFSVSDLYNDNTTGFVKVSSSRRRATRLARVAYSLLPYILVILY